jgi:hypothetical protein
MRFREAAWCRMRRRYLRCLFNLGHIGAAARAAFLVPLQYPKRVPHGATFPTWDGWDSRTEALEPAPNEATLPRKRSGNERNHLKTSQQSKQKHKSQRVHEPERAKQTFARVVETAGDKDVPDATVEFEQNWQKVMDAVGKKDVLTPRTDVEDWQKALYEEFLVWRSKQIMFGYAD